MEMQVYIANLGKYNEGEVVGAWFTPPIDMEDVKERIGLNEEYEEIAIHDYELPFDIHEYTPISEINRLTWYKRLKVLPCMTLFPKLMDTGLIISKNY